MSPQDITNAKLAEQTAKVANQGKAPAVKQKKETTKNGKPIGQRGHMRARALRFLDAKQALVSFLETTDKPKAAEQQKALDIAREALVFVFEEKLS